MKIKCDFLSAFALVAFMIFQLLEGGSAIVYLSIVLFFLFSMFSLIFSTSPEVFRLKVSDLFLFLFLLSMLFSVFVNLNSFDSVLTPFLWALGVLLSYFWGASIIKWPKILIFPGLAGVLVFGFWILISDMSWSQISSGELFLSSLGFIINPNRFSILVLIFFIGVSLSFWSDDDLGLYKTAAILLVSISILGVLLSTGSRAALGSSIFLLFLNISRIFWVQYREGRFLFRLISVVGVSTIWVHVISIINLVIFGMLYGSGREVIWKIALDAWLQSPVFGYGYGQSLNILSDSGIELSAHSAFVQLLVEGGLFSFVLFFLFIFSLARTRHRIVSFTIFKSFLLFVVFIIIFHQNFESVLFHLSPYSFLFFAFIGWTVKGNWTCYSKKTTPAY